jgi:hypothetical protein
LGITGATGEEEQEGQQKRRKNIQTSRPLLRIDALLKNRCDPRQYFVDNRVRNAFESFAAARDEIEGARPVAADDAGCLGAGARKGHSKSSHAREAAAAGDGQDDGYFGDAVERLRRHDQDRTMPLLLVSLSRIEPDQPDFTPFHSDQLAAHRFAGKPFALWPGARRFAVALAKQFVQRVTRPASRFHDETSLLDRDADFRPRPQAQDIEHGGWNGQHDRAAYFPQIGCVHLAIVTCYIRI